ncbi:MAG: type II toxin-antitoxin system VapC family toxin [Microscillaceae bacterium]|jgi:PIN domain nuclease of toxin-antitoxin system|nr:type II toxin-antitoxin system VapC family toxin [Microscillaceae bacterium]
MKLLLDTHTIIWFVEGNSSLSLTARQAIENPHNSKYVSIISFWEMMIKINLGKLEMKMAFIGFYEYLLRRNVSILPLELAHILHLQNLPTHHKDPFDRILIAQALSENMTLVSVDSNFSQYDITMLW